MGTKEFRIQVPEGYEIDADNSTLECIKFKPVKKNVTDITYEDICEKLFETEVYFIESHGDIVGTANAIGQGCLDKNNATNKKQLEKILALNQLLNIAEYCNKQNPKQGDNPYCITLDEVHEYREGAYDLSYASFGLVALFNRKEDAQAVINNPNFREILDTIYKQ